MSEKVRPEHLDRPALVYIRQSTLMQLHEHQQSTERQYALVELAKKLGWDAARIEVIDEDLGQSGTSAAHRTGFQRLAADVSLGKVGAIFSLEVSRLARSSADWHRLMDLCALADTLIVDEEGVYDASDFNDRLVLGMKGTMSDAEIHLMRQRLRGGLLHKAKKGELVFPPPTGYVFDNGTLVFDPDEQVQKAIRLLFERFRLDGSVARAVRYFTRHGLLFPSRHAHQGGHAEIQWHPLTTEHALTILRNPTYAGAYAWGRNRERRALVNGVVRRKHEKLAAPEQWHAFVKDAHPAYITWEEYTENLKRIEENATRFHGIHMRGAVREGEALLQGLVLCGRCGRRMYSSIALANTPVYECVRSAYGEGRCWSTVARRIDSKVAETFLEAMAPPELDLSLAVLKEVEQQADSLARQWKLRLERARYEAQRAERQYNAVEPENRVVARTLETRWNEKLQELARVEHEYEEAKGKQKLELSPQDKKSILALARDLPRLWNAPTTTCVDKKRMLRLLIQDVVLSPVDVPERATRIRILWKTGAISELMTPRPTLADSHKTPKTVLAAVRELAAQKYSDSRIAAELNQRGLKNGLGRSFTRTTVGALRRGHGLRAGHGPGGSAGPLPEQDEQGRYSTHGLIARYGVSAPMVRYWVRQGRITPVRSKKRGPFWFEMTPELQALLAKAQSHGYRAEKQPGISGRPRLPARLPDGRYTTRGLIEKYGVSESTVRYWVKTHVLTPERDLPKGSFCFRLTPALARRIKAALVRRRRARSPRQHHRSHPHSND
jgi:DNA invertase Pin-like site-specific DNA recombinase